jgi:hypothetical protein
MAATGLLGINPYFKGVNLDFSSKPVNLAIQLEQKNQAKREALDKYFMDYEKSINPAGMRSQDQDIVLKKLNDNKQFYMQNRDCILNPSKCGAEAQSRYLAGFKDIFSDISKSKQAYAENKVVQNTYSRLESQGLEIPDGFMEAVQNSQKPIYGGYQPVDLFKFDFNKPYDDVAFTKNVWGGLTLPTKEIPTTLPDGKVQYTKTSYLTPQLAETVAINAINEYRNKPSSTKNFNNLMKDANILNAAQEAFGEAFKYTDPKTKKIVKPTIESPEQFVAGYALLKKPTGAISTGKEDFPWLTKFKKQQEAINERADKKDEEMGDPVETFLTEARSGKTFSGVEGENIEVMNLPEYILKDLGKDKRPAKIGRGLGDGKFYNIVYQKEIDKKTGKETGNSTDLIDWTKTEIIPASQIRASVVSRALPSGAKVKLVEGAGSGKKNTSKFVNERKFN